MRFYVLTSESWTPPAWCRVLVVDEGQLTTCPKRRGAEMSALAAPFGHLESGGVWGASLGRVRSLIQSAGYRDVLASTPAALAAHEAALGEL